MSCVRGLSSSGLDGRSREPLSPPHASSELPAQPVLLEAHDVTQSLRISTMMGEASVDQRVLSSCRSRQVLCGAQGPSNWE